LILIVAFIFHCFLLFSFNSFLFLSLLLFLNLREKRNIFVVSFLSFPIRFGLILLSYIIEVLDIKILSSCIRKNIQVILILENIIFFVQTIMTRLNFTSRKHLHITLKDSSTLTRFMDASILVSCCGNFRFIVRIIVSWIILSRCFRLFLLLFFTFLDTFFCPRFEVDLLRELTEIIELESLHGVIVEIKSLQVDNDRITQFFNVRSSGRINLSVVFLTHILVVTIEMIRFDKQV